mmetsp:Transcript_4854/g.10736  ORF Transcript_4854/g.10736 Transcript_4854/m.10736 type:complete len:289 (+) Transcript_4854:81-947(+)
MRVSPPPASALGRLTYRSVEFSSSLPFADLAALSMPPTHYVLPDLPGIVTNDVMNDFRLRTNVTSFDNTNEGKLPDGVTTQPTKPIMTIAAAQHESSASIIKAARERLEVYGADTLLIVGGNTMSDSSITTLQAINQLQDAFPDNDFTLFCTWDPNFHKDIEDLVKKIDAGVAGIITQPPLTSVAWHQLTEYCSDSTLEGIDLIAGVALPKSTRQLQFWSSLLKDPNSAANDKVFRNTLKYFNDPAFDTDARQMWAMEQRDRLLSYDSLGGVHFMPLGNAADLLHLLR